MSIEALTQFDEVDSDIALARIESGTYHSD